MRVRVEPTLCQGHSRCVRIAPSLFRSDDDGYASAVGDGTVPAGEEEDAELAADNCPEEAVVIDRD